MENDSDDVRPHRVVLPEERHFDRRISETERWECRNFKLHGGPELIQPNEFIFEYPGSGTEYRIRQDQFALLTESRLFPGDIRSITARDQYLKEQERPPADDLVTPIQDLRRWSEATRPNITNQELADKIEDESFMPNWLDALALDGWLNIILLAVDGYSRNGGRPKMLLADLRGKFQLNQNRVWDPSPKTHTKEPSRNVRNRVALSRLWRHQRNRRSPRRLVRILPRVRRASPIRRRSVSVALAALRRASVLGTVQRRNQGNLAGKYAPHPSPPATGSNRKRGSRMSIEHYHSYNLKETADYITREADTPLQAAFAAHLRKVATALDSLRRVYDGDDHKGEEEKDLREVVSDAAELEIIERLLRANVRSALEVLQRLDQRRESGSR